MSTQVEIADWQTDNVILWAINDEHLYNSYASRIEKVGLFNGVSAKRIVKFNWGDKAPDGSGLSKVRWGVVARCFNDGHTPGLKMRSIKILNKAAGQHFFSEGTTRFFNAQYYPNTRGVLGGDGKTIGTLFVTSERCDWNDDTPTAVLEGIDSLTNGWRRKWSLRLFDHQSKQVRTVGDYSRFISLELALSAMRNYEHGKEGLI